MKGDGDGQGEEEVEEARAKDRVALGRREAERLGPRRSGSRNAKAAGPERIEKRSAQRKTANAPSRPRSSSSRPTSSLACSDRVRLWRKAPERDGRLQVALRRTSMSSSASSLPPSSSTPSRATSSASTTSSHRAPIITGPAGHAQDRDPGAARDGRRAAGEDFRPRSTRRTRRRPRGSARGRRARCYKLLPALFDEEIAAADAALEDDNEPLDWSVRS